jgi:hypothetical protein
MGGGPPTAPCGKLAAGSKARPRSRRCFEAVWEKPSHRRTPVPSVPSDEWKSLMPLGTPHGLESAEQLRLYCRKLFLGQEALVSERG